MAIGPKHLRAPDGADRFPATGHVVDPMSILPAYQLWPLKGFTYAPPLRQWCGRTLVPPLPPHADAPVGAATSTIAAATVKVAAPAILRMPNKPVSFVGLRG
jgi:hypothetical protein